MRSWRLDDAAQTFALAAADDRLPCVVYWGPRLPDDADVVAIAAAQRIDIAGGALDVAADLSICPEAAQGFPGQPGLSGRDAAGSPLAPRFRLTDAAATPDALTFEAADADAGLTYAARFDLRRASGVIVVQATLNAAAPITLDWLAAPVLPASAQAEEMIDFAGRWAG